MYALLEEIWVDTLVVAYALQELSWYHAFGRIVGRLRVFC